MPWLRHAKSIHYFIMVQEHVIISTFWIGNHIWKYYFLLEDTTKIGRFWVLLKIYAAVINLDVRFDGKVFF